MFDHYDSHGLPVTCDKAEAELRDARAALAERSGWDHLSEDWHSAQRCGHAPCPGCIIEELHGVIDATRRMAIDTNTAVRNVLLAALGQQDDGRTPLLEYAEKARAELAAYEPAIRSGVTLYQHSCGYAEELTATDIAEMDGSGWAPLYRKRPLPDIYARRRGPASSGPTPGETEEPRDCTATDRGFACSKKAPHPGERHTADLGVGTYTWGYEPKECDTVGEPKLGFGRRNPHCSNCGDERGGPVGHEISECRYRSGMVAWEVAQILPEHRRDEFWDVMIDRHMAAEDAMPPAEAEPVPAATGDTQDDDRCVCGHSLADRHTRWPAEDVAVCVATLDDGSLCQCVDGKPATPGGTGPDENGEVAA